MSGLMVFKSLAEALRAGYQVTTVLRTDICQDAHHRRLGDGSRLV